MSRKLRRVPAGWEHPKKENGQYQPMHDEYYGDALAEWHTEKLKWDNGTHEWFNKHPEDKGTPYEDYAGDKPDRAYYLPVKYREEELTHIQLYEDVTEGTPVSPVFKADELDALCEYAEKNCTTFADFKATKEQWKEMLTAGFVHHTSGNITFI